MFIGNGGDLLIEMGQGPAQVKNLIFWNVKELQFPPEQSQIPQIWLKESEAGIFLGAVCGDCGVSSALDILVPKAGFFCQICSLFYADEPSMINHCRTPLHRQNMEVLPRKTGTAPQILGFGGVEKSLGVHLGWGLGIWNVFIPCPDFGES